MVLKQRTDLVLVDIEMPFITGLEFVDALNADPDMAGIAVLFVSSREDLEDKAKELGAGAFLKQPRRADALLLPAAAQVQAGRTAR